MVVRESKKIGANEFNCGRTSAECPSQNHEKFLIKHFHHMADIKSTLYKLESEDTEMKINQTPGISGINPYQKQLKKADEVKTSSAAAGDKLEISNAAKEMQDSTRLLAERREKIALLKEQVAGGTYKADAQTTAKAMLNFYGQQ
jgi:negative regulator of flagellin synthesis FlgM